MKFHEMTERARGLEALAASSFPCWFSMLPDSLLPGPHQPPSSSPWGLTLWSLSSFVPDRGLAVGAGRSRWVLGTWCLRARMTLTVPTNTSGIRPVLRPLGAASGHLTALHPGMSVSHHRSLKTLQGPLSVVEGGVNAPERHGRELTCPDLPPPRHSSGISYRPALMPHINGQPHTCVTC